ncbi:MAG: response regulator, partial [Gemmataceae bacterium]
MAMFPIRWDRWTLVYFLTLAALLANLAFLTMGSPKQLSLQEQSLFEQATLGNVENLSVVLAESDAAAINLAMTGDAKSAQQLQNHLALLGMLRTGIIQLARESEGLFSGVCEEIQSGLAETISQAQALLKNQNQMPEGREERWKSIMPLRKALNKSQDAVFYLREGLAQSLNESSRAWQVQVQERNLAVWLTSFLGLVLFALMFVLRGQHEKKQLAREQELRASYQFLQSTMDAMESHICILDEKGSIQAVNAAWKRFGVTQGFESGASNIGQNYLEVCEKALGDCAHDSHRVAQGIRDVLAKKTSLFYLEYPCHGPDQMRWFAVRATGFTWKNQPRIVVAHENITDRILANQALMATQEQNQKLALVASRTSNADLISDAKGVVQWVNDGFSRQTGYRPEEVAGRKQAELLHGPKTDPAIEQNIEECIARGLGFDMEILQYSRDKKPFWAQVRCEPVHDERGNLSNFVTIESDITERRAFIEDLTKAKQEAESANRAKSEFLANVSHEIRTPLNGVIGMTGLLLDTPLSPEQHEFVETSLTSAQSLLTIINDILDYSKIEAGKLDLHPEPFALRSVIHQMAKPFSLRAGEKNIELAVRVAKEVPDHWIGDSERLKQVLSNLVGNAIKFTSRGEIELNVELKSSGSEKPLLHFSVRDTGIGVPADKLETIFRPFEQADGSTIRRFGGTGLGLAICSQLVAKMGGTIWVESQLGHGSQFHFTAHLEMGQPELATTRNPPGGLAGVPVLVIDDNSTSRRILEEIVAGWHMKPHGVSSGEAGLAELERAEAAKTPYQVVLLDAGMPQMDGFLLAEKIHKNDRLNPHIVMMLSSADRLGEVARCRETGVAHHLAKPINPEELLRAILDVDGPTDPPAAPSLVPIKPRKSAQGILKPGGLKILLAEDNLVNQKVAQKTLAKMGHLVVTVNNGREALDALDRESFDLVLMDVQMPEMDGLEATRRLREKERATGEHLHVIAITAHAMKGDRDRCEEAGMDNYITKPLQPGDLYRVLAESPLEASPWNYKEAMLTRIGGSEEMLRELIDVLVAEVPSTME